MGIPWHEMPEVPKNVIDAFSGYLHRGGGMENRLKHLEVLMATIICRLDAQMSGGKLKSVPYDYLYWLPQKEQILTSQRNFTPDQLAAKVTASKGI